ncbi:Rhamnogalacturonan lyase B, N-terminal [Rhizoctonia solani]|uniref:rhamnogalacturonan endolyase n=1 Tax=Rhizoctonia solani TaxID=456999 RepID=A0A8H7IDW1_9AGAM|nr:Rhamnogalacturonan lyase B, N-terminal [Rhizoctonia solani]
MNWKSAIALAFAACTPGVLAAFGVTTGSGYLSVDTGGGLVFRVSTSSGDITSLKYNNIECQDSSKYTHIGSGLGSATVSYKISGNYATITIATSTLTQYYRCGTAIEGSDVYSLNGQTRSKFFSSVQFIKDQVHGVTGNGVGVYMVMPGNAYETSGGGPFFRDINNQAGSQQELYWYMNSGHMVTQSFRTGFFGPYAMVFTSGNAPSASLDTSFFANLGIKGYVAASGRGTVKGTVSGVPSGFTAVVGLDNSAAQYWGTVSGTSYTINGVKPGTYKATLYKKELEVGTGSVTVSAGGTATLNLASTESIKSNIWQIGLPDGTPSGFLNADKIESMHPFVAVNNPTTIKWTATSSQIGARTLRIRTTSSFAGGRPAIKVNNWSSANPAAPTKIDSRGVTRGTWRGYNQLYEYAIPSGTLVAGSNTITISVISGSSGDAFLSPNVVYDSVELY